MSMERLDKRSLKYVVKRAVREFSQDQCTDLAAALTYYAVLSILPAAVALTAMLGVVGQAEESVDTLLEVLAPLVSDDMLGNIEPTLRDLANSQGAGIALIVGLAGALWTASGYVGAFSRAMNRIYEVEEGRPIWKLRPQMLLLTLVLLVLMALVLVMLVVSGGLARSIGDVIGLGSTAVTVWNIAKWPVLAVVVMVIVAMLYYFTPNVKHPKIKWLSPGAIVALVTGVIASVGFTFYVANFASYNKTYGSLAGVIVALLFLWITNLALLLGAEIDAELERGRELEAGVPAEVELQLPLRDSRNVDKSADKEQKQIDEGRKIRLESGQDPAQDEATETPTTQISDHDKARTKGDVR
ncbi:YihY/virulence factor BrkB family protein [Nocardioides houyundeii]|uniref:YihY/virulence factor BrkB family protein n=1 Tax=Nocardioides houyundeii TaxID=2045452 RepID=UPI0013B3FD0C|nr:YihY/virulence factor BrkB family protein [Nocardioides houyundeii]